MKTRIIYISLGLVQIFTAERRRVRLLECGSPQTLDALLARQVPAGAICHVIADLPGDMLLREAMPPALSPADQPHYLARCSGERLAEWPYRQIAVLPDERHWQAAAVSAHPLLDAVLAQLLHQRALLRGLYGAPMLAATGVDPCRPLVLLASAAPGEMRQILFDEQGVRYSRLVSWDVALPAPQQQALQQLEIQRLQQHLHTQAQDCEVHLLDAAGLAQASDVLPGSGIRQFAMPAWPCNTAQAADWPSWLASIVASGRHLTRLDAQGLYDAWREKVALLGMSLFALIMASLMVIPILIWWLDAQSLQRAALRLQHQHHTLQQQLQHKRKQLAEWRDIDTAQFQIWHNWRDKTGAKQPDAEASLQAVSRLLADAPSLRLEKASWRMMESGQEQILLEGGWADSLAEPALIEDLAERAAPVWQLAQDANPASQRLKLTLLRGDGHAQ